LNGNWAGEKKEKNQRFFMGYPILSYPPLVPIAKQWDGGIGTSFSNSNKNKPKVYDNRSDGPLLSPTYLIGGGQEPCAK
jgi:hypothetical protein